MGRSYSSDLRVRIYGEIEQGGSRRAAAQRFGVSASTSIRLAQRMAATGSLAPARQGRPPGGGKLAPHADFLIGWVEKQGDITMLELAAKLNAERGVTAHPASLSRFLLTRGYSVKKNAAGERGRSR
ncbi:transposase [Azospirillum picis]|uniref:Transposase n=1 Tax=Azospirillum picis TaxID=488438 RepID=A0ABU0MM84_9PROT|nr:transposase [Azospirillum picis]MDQ0534542.1 transposase [Azospirillum picis]